MLNYSVMTPQRRDSVDGLRLGANVAELRSRQGLGREELARKAGISSGYIYRLETGVHPNASRKTAMKLAGAFDLTVEGLLLPVLAQAVRATPGQPTHRAAPGKELSQSEIDSALEALKRLPPAVRHQRIESLQFDADMWDASHTRRLNEESAEYDAGEESTAQ